MRILGLIGSYRKLGNTEVLVKEALMEAKRLGADVDVLRLTDLKIEPCKGCMACVFKQEECRIRDDWSHLRDMLEKSDGVVLGAPTYILGPPGIVKMIIDRNIAVMYQRDPSKIKPGAIIGVAGIKGWESFTLPILNLFMLSLGFKVIDQEIFYAQGPGEILLNDSAMERARKIGFNLYQMASQPPEGWKYVGEPGQCPNCHQNLFIVKNGKAECAVCKTNAEIEITDGAIRLTFNPEKLNEHRWSDKALKENLFSAVLSSGPRFLEEKPEIEKRARKYLNLSNKG
jgi:multimeric flavodoxin WrbA